MEIDFLTVHIVEVTAEAGGRFKQTRAAYEWRVAAAEWAAYWRSAMRWSRLSRGVVRG